MTWTKLDDGFPDHEKIIGLSDGAFRLHVLGLCYANRLETDGRVPKAAPFVLARKKYLRELLGVVWEEAGTHYMIHDFLDYNPSHSELTSKRDSKRMAGAKGAASRWHGNGNAPDPVPSRPDPVPIDGDLDGQRASARDALRPLADQLFQDAFGVEPGYRDLWKVVDALEEHGELAVREALRTTAGYAGKSWKYAEKVLASRSLS